MTKTHRPRTGLRKKKNGCWFSGCAAARCPRFCAARFPASPWTRWAAPVAAARECFGADFTEEPFGELTREGFRARLSRAPPVGADGKYRVWSGVDARTFLDAAARSSDADGDDAAFFFDGVVGDLPPSRSSHSTPASEIFRTIRASNVLDAERAVVALAGGWTRDARRSFGAACAAAAAAFGGDRTTAACEPDDVPELDAPFSFSFSSEADEASRPTKRAKSDKDKDKGKDDEIAHRRRFEHAEGRAGVVIVGVGAAASPPAWAAYSDAARRLRSAGVAAGPSPFAVDEAELVRGSGGSEDTHPSAVWHVSYRASDEDAGESEAAAAARAAAAAEARANAGHDAWDVFGDSGAGGAGSGGARPGGGRGGDAEGFYVCVLAETYPGTLWAPPPRLPARPPGTSGTRGTGPRRSARRCASATFPAFRSVPERSRFRGSGIAPR